MERENSFVTGVHVWIVDLVTGRAEVERALGMLSAAERTRFERLRVAEKAAQFAVTRACLRKLLSMCSGREIYDLKIVVNPHGKPLLLESRWEFNVSHSGRIAAIAIAQRTRVGIDIEQLEGSDEAALRRWTERESCVKAQGSALPIAGEVKDPGWSRCGLRQLPAGYVGTLTAEGSTAVHEWRLPSDVLLTSAPLRLEGTMQNLP